MSQKTEPEIDMSETAIGERIAEVASLNRLCESLGEAGRSIDVKAHPPRVRFRICEGLPPYGPPAVPFGGSAHSEGFVVEFQTSDGESWVGNFGRGLSNYSGVFELPGSSLLFVIARGQGYAIDPEQRTCIRVFGSTITAVLEQPDCLLIATPCELEAIAGANVRWRTRRIAWDGTRDLRVDGQRVLGEAYDSMNDIWVAFAVDLPYGEVTGGSFPPELDH